MIDIQDLYQDLIVDHGRHPRNTGCMSCPSHSAKGFNPLCGDEITLQLSINKNSIIEDVKFNATGCAISVASASLMSEELKGKNINDANTIFEQFHKMVTNDTSETNPVKKIYATKANINMGKLKVLAGVKSFPTRVKCATLAWHTLQEALKYSEDAHTVSTEE